MKFIPPQENEKVEIRTGDIITYQTEQGEPLNVHWEEETVWLTQQQMSVLFGRGRSTITEHINNVFRENELEKNSVCRDFRHTAADGKVYTTTHYNLDVIISVGYRVKSPQGTKFRIWANQVLKNYLLKGYVMRPVNRQELDDIREELRNLEITTDAQFSEIYEALIALVSRKQTEEKPRNPIGFIHLKKE